MPARDFGKSLKMRLKNVFGDRGAASRAGEEARQPATALGVPSLDLSVEPRADKTRMTEPTIRRTPALSTSQRLWNAAYDSLEEEEGTAELARLYVRTLMNVLGTKPETASGADVSTDLRDPTKRQIFMEKLLEEGKAKVVKASKITKGVGDFANAILLVKPMVDLAIRNIPQAAPAALPWAGVCAGLQILSNPAKATKSNLAGIMHVVSRMDWYCVLSEHLLKEDTSFNTVLQELEKKGLVFLRDLANRDDWDGYLKAVTDAEDNLLNDWDKYDKLKARSLSGALVKHGEEAQSRLGDIRQTLGDYISLLKKKDMDGEKRNFLRDLFVVDPQLDMKTIEKKKDNLLDAAYEWVLGTKEYAAFTDWSNEESALTPCRLLWIKGPAGTGKTMLMIGIIRSLSDHPAVFCTQYLVLFLSRHRCET